MQKINGSNTGKRNWVSKVISTLTFKPSKSTFGPPFERYPIITYIITIATATKKYRPYFVGNGLLFSVNVGLRQSHTPSCLYLQRTGTVFAHSSLPLVSLYMKIPPSPLYQRGVRGDFHASLWQQAMWVILNDKWVF